MSFAEILLAAAMLSGEGPPECNQPEFLQASFPTLRLALTNVALEWQILDARETRHILVRQEEFNDDLQLLRNRYRDLLDAPPVVDALRFPDRATINDFLVFNRAYLKYLEMRQPLEVAPGPDLYVLQREVEDLYRIWDTVRDARCEYYYIWVRRHALKRLRDMLGDEDYYRGNLPPYVPLWRFQVLN
jgi:hypothetical protein